MGTPLRDHSAIHFTITTIKTEVQCLTIPRAVGEGGWRVPSSNTCTVHLCVSDHKPETCKSFQLQSRPASYHRDGATSSTGILGMSLPSVSSRATTCKTYKTYVT